MNIIRILVILFVIPYRPTTSVLGKSSVVTVTEWLKPGSEIEFDAKEVPHYQLLNRLNWVEKNERSTSKNYTLWEKADLYLLEWPGKVTIFDQNYPTVKWGRQRAKYVEDFCGQEFTGIEMRAYAYKYVYLTWGPNRLTKTYSPPLTVPRSILPRMTLARLHEDNSYEPNKVNTIVAYDIAFVFDTLLIAFSGGVIRVSGLEMAWAEMTQTPNVPVKYSLSKGIGGFVDRLVTQSCCVKTDFCPYGDMVVAYKEYSNPHVIYTSFDAGKTFKTVSSTSPQITPGKLRVVLSYPEINRLLILHGNNREVQLTIWIHSSYVTQYDKNNHLPVLRTTGIVQGNRLGMDSSFIIWDDCNVWYSPDVGSNLTKSLLYINKKIRYGASKHRILSKQCTFGKLSKFAYGLNGKFGILDANNVFFLGVDTKANLSQLVALQVDMTLLRDGSELSVHPYFDNVEQPRLWYPPRFLQLPEKLNMGKSYEKRLGMRLLLKNVYPSDYILSFYEENAKMSIRHNKFALQPCQTSSLSVNNSITQRRKFYTLSSIKVLNFTVSFKSRSTSLRQLNFEPRRITRLFNIFLRPTSIGTVQTEEPKYFLIKYLVMIKPRSSSTINKVFRMNFYTQNTLRCNPQPRITVYLKHVEDRNVLERSINEDDMTHSVFLKSVSSAGDGVATYISKKPQEVGEIMKVDTCPLSKAMKNKH